MASRHMGEISDNNLEHDKLQTMSYKLKAIVERVNTTDEAIEYAIQTSYLKLIQR